MDDEQQKRASDSDWVRLQREESDRRLWLWKLITRSVLWIVAAVAGVHALIEKIGDFVKWLQPK